VSTAFRLALRTGPLSLPRLNFKPYRSFASVSDLRRLCFVYNPKAGAIVVGMKPQTEIFAPGRLARQLRESPRLHARQ